jgi:signal transduction histidine kinase
MTVIVIVQLSLMGLVTLVVEKRQRDAILHESQKRALALVTNLAALSESDLLSYNFVKLEQTVERLVASEEDVGYAIVHTRDGTVAAYSGHREKRGEVLEDLISRRALLANAPLIQEITTAALRGKGYDVAIPVLAQGSTRKWGTIRLGFSLARARQEIRDTSRDLVLLGVIAILLGTGVAVLLALRISQPIQQLVTAVNAVAKGNYDHAIAVTTHDEVGHLAQRFEEMREALRLHITRLAAEKRRLEWANSMIKETQKQLIQNEKLAAVGKLTAQVAHEFNNPLAIIKTSLHIINTQMSSADPNKENLVVIEEEITRMARIIRQLLDFSRPVADISTLQVNEVIERLMKMLATEFAQRDIDSKLDLAPDLPLLRMSSDQLKQVLLNLIKNAEEAMPTGGTLVLRTARRLGGLTISILDNGIGIAKESLPFIFEPFFSTKQTGEGLGLGLAVSHSIIKSYGGAIEVDSHPGKGTLFRIFLPEYPTLMVGENLQEESTLRN